MNVRRSIEKSTLTWTKYGGKSLFLEMECGHNKLISRPPARVPKTTICWKCTKEKSDER